MYTMAINRKLRMIKISNSCSQMLLERSLIAINEAKKSHRLPLKLRRLNNNASY